VDTCDLKLGTDKRGSHLRQISDICSVIRAGLSRSYATVWGIPNACSFVISERLAGMSPNLKKLHHVYLR
jgi:hypothetical protein